MFQSRGDDIVVDKNQKPSYAYQNSIFQVHLSSFIRVKSWVFGPSGVGKSTLLQLIRGNLTPLSGHIQCRVDLTLSRFGLVTQLDPC